MAFDDDKQVGRPLAKFDLPDGWQDEILNLYKTGASDVEVKSLIWYQRGSFSNDLWERWMKDEEQFSETVKVGKMLSEAWWTSQGRMNLKSKDFNFVGWYMNMKNRFNWKDKTETALTDPDGNAVPIQIIQLPSNNRGIETKG